MAAFLKNVPTHPYAFFFISYVAVSTKFYDTNVPSSVTVRELIASSRVIGILMATYITACLWSIILDSVTDFSYDFVCICTSFRLQLVWLSLRKYSTSTWYVLFILFANMCEKGNSHRLLMGSTPQVFCSWYMYRMSRMSHERSKSGDDLNSRLSSHFLALYA